MNYLAQDRISKIFSEPALITNNYYHVVYDADPVVDGHIIVLPKVAVLSFADSGLPMLADFLNSQEVNRQFPKGFFFFERGRASFCTSMDGAKHAHCHLIPYSELALDTISKLTTQLKARQTTCMEDVISIVSSGGEYLLMGSHTGKWIVSYPFKPPVKRFIRRALAGVI